MLLLLLLCAQNILADRRVPLQDLEIQDERNVLLVEHLTDPVASQRWTLREALVRVVRVRVRVRARVRACVRIRVRGCMRMLAWEGALTTRPPSLRTVQATFDEDDDGPDSLDATDDSGMSRPEVLFV
jgi:hypothetical protein